MTATGKLFIKPPSIKISPFSIAGGPMPGIEMLARTAFHNMPAQ